MSARRSAAERQMGQQPRAPHVGQDRIDDLADLASHGVGMDLRPQVRVGAAPDESQRREPPLGVLLDRTEQPGRVEGDALEDGAHHVRPGRRERNVVEAPPDGVVVDR